MAAIGIFGMTGVAALAADIPSASRTFMSVAEKFGVFAAMCVALTASAVYGLWRLTQYVINRMETVIDDNTMAFMQFARLMERRPCITNSDVDSILLREREDEPDSGNGITNRINERRKTRETKNTF